MTTPETGEEMREAQAAEYGRYRALERIYVDGVLAFNPGDAVPVGHVKNKVVNAAQVEDLAKSEKKG